MGCALCLRVWAGRRLLLSYSSCRWNGEGLYHHYKLRRCIQSFRQTGWPHTLPVCCRDSLQSGAVLVLGCNDWQRSMLYRELHRMCNNQPETASLTQQDRLVSEAPETTQSPQNDLDIIMPVDVTNEISAAGRIDLYRSKPCLFVTTRILVVDMLNARIQGQHIAGMVILNAQRVTEASGEAFAVRLYRMANRNGFIRAFSDQPTSFASGFNKVCHRKRTAGVGALAEDYN